MSFNWSNQQLAIFDEVSSGEHSELAILATAGAAKSSSLAEAIARYKHTNPTATVRYLVFGNLAAKEARSAFGTNAIVTTLHSFAYHYIVKVYKLGQVKSFLTWRDIPKSVRRPFGKDPEILRIVDDYCGSEYLNVQSYVDGMEDDSFQYNLIPAVKQILNLMATGRMPITHTFYLKLFHIFVMNGTIKLPHTNRLLVDEGQDMSSMALDIIQKVPTDQLVIVGDRNQRIFSFMKLIDGFARFPNAHKLTLSQSFRVDQSYAPVIQAFLRKHLEPDAVFNGMVYTDTVKPKSRAYLTRTNASLIAKMIELNKANEPYHLSHNAKIKQMFKLPLAVIYAKPGFMQKDPELKHFQELVDNYGKLPKHQQEKQSLYSYLMNLDELDSATFSAIKLVLNFNKDDIIEAHDKAESHKSQCCDLQLMTAHTSKGITRDIVELDPDIDKSLRDALSSSFKGTEEDRRSELCLYFVAITRHRHTLIGTNYLKELIDD
jgi:superfamily I DNA/RNA helicase